jgi:hypothetical protein
VTVTKYLLEIEHTGEPAARLMQESVLISTVTTAVMSANGDDEEFELTGVRVEVFEPGHPDYQEER